VGKLCSYFGDEVLDIPLDDPNLLFVSVSEVKETELGAVERALAQDVPPEVGLARAFLEGSNTLGPYVQIVCNVKVWFDASNVSLLLLGAPDLPEYGHIGPPLQLEQAGLTHHFAVRLGRHGVGYDAVHVHVLLGAALDALPFVPLPHGIPEVRRDHRLPGIGHLIQPSRHGARLSSR